MTEKQKSCIEWICRILSVTYYGKDTVRDASKFISKFIDRAKEVQKECDFYGAWGTNYLLGKPFGGRG